MRAYAYYGTRARPIRVPLGRSLVEAPRDLLPQRWRWGFWRVFVRVDGLTVIVVLNPCYNGSRARQHIDLEG